jgi:hypothetical protein
MLAKDPIMFQHHPGFRHFHLQYMVVSTHPKLAPLCTTCKAVPQLITIEIEWLRLRKLSLDDGCIVCHHLSRTLHLCAPIGLGSQGDLGARWTVFLTWWLQLETPTWHDFQFWMYIN